MSGHSIPLPKELQGNEKIGDVARVSFLNQDWGTASDQLFPGLPSRKLLKLEKLVDVYTHIPEISRNRFQTNFYFEK